MWTRRVSWKSWSCRSGKTARWRTSPDRRRSPTHHDRRGAAPGRRRRSGMQIAGPWLEARRRPAPPQAKSLWKSPCPGFRRRQCHELATVTLLASDQIARHILRPVAPENLRPSLSGDEMGGYAPDILQRLNGDLGFHLGLPVAALVALAPGSGTARGSRIAGMYLEPILVEIVDDHAGMPVPHPPGIGGAEMDLLPGHQILGDGAHQMARAQLLDLEGGCTLRR